MMRRSLFVPLAVALGVLASLTGCDTTDPEPPASPEEVAGTYRFTELRFDPQPAFVPDAVVLDTLVAADTFVELFDGGQFALRYRFEGGLQAIVNGTFDVTTTRVTLEVEDDFRSLLRRLLLHAPLRLVRTGTGALTLEDEVRVDLEAFSPVYEDTGLDLTDVPGTLTLRLVPTERR